MTLWFDVSDLCIWREPQLTGIQRTAFNVLDELIALRGDLRLFRCTPSHKLQAVERGHLRPTTDAARPEAVRSAERQFELPLRHRLRDLLHRCASEEVALALKDGARNAAALWRALRGTELTGNGGMDCHRLRPPVAPAQLPRLSRPFFSDGDICLSMSATWQFAHYGELIARHKATTDVRVVNLLYDLIPLLQPQWLSPGNAHRLAAWTQQQMINSDLILATSEFQKRKIEEYLRQANLPLRTVKTIRLGDQLGDSVQAAAAPPPYMPSRPFVLCVATIDVRKNHACLYHVWKRMAERHGQACPELLLIGMTHDSGLPLLRQIRHDPRVSRLIVHLPDVADRHLAWYYRHCLFTVYPSLYEGWGLPVGESLAAGKYCIASNAASLPEVGGAWVDYFDPIDFKGCLDLVERALARPDNVHRREREIRNGFKPHPWRETARQISRLVDAVGADNSPSTAAAHT